MRPFFVTILGSNSAIPAHGRHPSSQWIQMGSRQFLMDCGEGTQMRAMQLNQKTFKLDAIFISHMHGDHVFGLPGLLTTLALLRRTEPMAIFGPPGLKTWLDHTFDITGAVFPYPLHIVTISANSEKVIAYEDEEVLVEAFPLEHRIPTNGYVFTLKKDQLKLDGHKAEHDNVPFDARSAMKKGEDYRDEQGRLWKYKDYTSPGESARSYAYCSDTIYDESIVSFIREVDLLYHEATYLHEMHEQAAERFHTTAKECGQIARKAQVGQLLLGHVSSRYAEVDPLEEEARHEFANCQFAREGESFLVG